MLTPGIKCVLSAMHIIKYGLSCRPPVQYTRGIRDQISPRFFTLAYICWLQAITMRTHMFPCAHGDPRPSEPLKHLSPNLTQGLHLWASLWTEGERKSTLCIIRQSAPAPGLLKYTSNAVQHIELLESQLLNKPRVSASVILEHLPLSYIAHS